RVGNRSVPGSYVSIHYNRKPILELAKNFNKETRVSIASVTKPFTAIAVMQLVDRQYIQLDQNVSDYIPELKNLHSTGREIKVKDLLYQTSGIPYRSRIGTLSVKTDLFFLNVPVPVHPPGTHFEYSNFNYIILAKLIQTVTGKSYADYIQQNIFTPLEMKHSDASRSTGAGGIISTAEDLIHFASMLSSGGIYNQKRLISNNGFQLMFSVPEYMNEKENLFYYGMGFRVIHSRGKTAAFYHTGIHKGTLAEFKIYPQNRSFIVHVSNPPNPKNPSADDYRWKMMSYFNDYVSNVFTPENTIAPRNLHPSLPDESDYSKYSGIYINQANSNKIKIIKKRNTIYRINNKFLERLKPLNSIEFQSSNRYYPYQFVWNDQQVTGLSTADGFYKRFQNEQIRSKEPN
ncbi:MAG: beta-lactamase family protein, partial [Spirochaetia bacterium]|nr:beta-lactamase family protein [Spirochaetia bacterium]